MANQFRVCDCCKATNINTLVPRLKEIDNEAEIIIGCQNFCGIGATKSFAIVNGIPIVTDNEDSLIEKIKEVIKK
ncbi:MAG: DUF1450 domain-containing protein [Mollicutes bacterium]|jgi:uncharacterized protein YuzB (UPF0349 family)|nr:DUF1450 domain-containing protein [Mollicutes bacterium]